jgi:RNA polymerase sigma factor (sigma-70 family)
MGVPPHPTRTRRSGPPPFERVIELHGPALLRFCVAQVGPQRAEDCFQEAMLAALRAYGTLRDAGAVRPWLFAIAARKAVDAHRAAAAAARPVADLESVGGSAVDGEPADAALWARVGALPDKQRHAVALRYLADLSHAEIAEAMGISEPAARRNVFEGLRSLREDA